MNKIEDAFKRELGKNTGKWVSNLIFGDGHSTPYRRAESKREMLHEQRLAQIESENLRREKDMLLAIDGAVLQNINVIATMKIPDDKVQLVDLLSELSIQVKANKWHGSSKEGKIRNKFCEALLEKYTQAVHKLRTLSQDDPQLEYFEKIGKDFKQKGFFKKYQRYLILLLMAFGLFSFYLFEKGLLGVVFGPIIFLILAIAGYKFYKRNSEKENTTSIQNSKEEAAIEEPKAVKESIFFDLNENNRIERRLAEIWAKYNGKIDRRTATRKPIFSADGVKDSILFVGINPSYNPADDNTFVSSSDNKSLMYGSLYQLLDAPEYFKKLESLAGKVNKAYTHINLLYARENDRELLSNYDHNFIREQLELSYETIVKINPVAIVFFSNYCRDLVFGEERWVRPNSELNGHYILKGTNFPVFFTDDVTFLSVEEQAELINKIRNSIY